MSKPPVHAFFLGRALAEALYEQLEQTITTAVSNFSKFDAEQRERLKEFTDQVIERANRQAEKAMEHSDYSDGVHSSDFPPEDLQAEIDDLRAEVAELKSELKQHRNHL